MKKKLGIVGGMGARAGASLLQKIIEYSPAKNDQEFVEIVLHSNSAIPDRTKAILYQGESSENELLRSVKLLESCGVDLVILACITSHYYLDVLRSCTTVDIMNPMEEVALEISTRYPEVRSVGLLATSGTLSARLFNRAFEKRGLHIVTLDADQQENLFMRSVYMPGGLKSANISPQAIHLIFDCCDSLLANGAEVIIGGCSEVQLALDNKEVTFPFVDVMDTCAKRAVARCYTNQSVLLSH